MATSASVALGHAHHADALDPERGQHIQRLPHLPRTAIDEQDIRQAALTVLDSPIATLQGLVHGREHVLRMREFVIDVHEQDQVAASGRELRIVQPWCG